MAFEAQFLRFTLPTEPLFSYKLAEYIYHFKHELEYHSTQNYTIEPFVYALFSQNSTWPSTVRLVKLVKVGEITYAFTGHITSEIQYYEIDKYTSSTVDINFLNTGQQATVYSNGNGSMAMLIRVDVTDVTVTNELLEYLVPVSYMPGYSNITIPAVNTNVTVNEYAGLTQSMKNSKLFAAVRKGDSAMVQQLLAAGANVHADRDWTLRLAAKKGHVEVVEQLLAAGVNVHAERDWALRFAAKKGHVEVVKQLLAAGADVHAKNDWALRHAVRNDRVEVVKVLLDHTTLQNRYIVDTIEAALNSTSNSTLQQLLRDYNIDGMTQDELDELNRRLIEAAKDGYVLPVKQLLVAGANVHANNDEALRWAALRGHVEVVKELLANGADVHAENNSALKMAARNGHVEVVKELLADGADVHAERDWALRRAAENGHVRVVKQLLASGANIHAMDDWALRHALRYATRYDYLEIVKVLLDHTTLENRYSADTIEALLTTTDNAMIQQLLRDYNTGEMLTRSE